MKMHSTRKLVALICFLLLFVGLGVTARAQGIYQGKITGTVASPDGALLPGATVEVSSPGLLGNPIRTAVHIVCSRPFDCT